MTDGPLALHLMPDRDPRAIAFARYLRVTAQDFSEVAESMDMVSVAEAGLVLLDAAEIVQEWTVATPELRELDRAGRFSTGADGRVRFVTTEAIRHELRLGLFAELQSPPAVIACVVELGSRPEPEGPLT